ncbi:hypothetical protein [Citrobacter amalonaticus]|uniref:hypothetical protein n=1 Tax=Citrobacter amalonaticus TaxID=35703 RepID=UPI000F661B5D|nr:hypothetical protein [Citrobacter amalonaticus]RSC52087.1 hypothetical protein EGW07_25380 [Citrobacter amalonaticus]
MDFSKFDFNHDCYVDLHVGDYGSLSGLFFSGKSDIAILEKLFTDSHDWQNSFLREGRQYMMGFVEPGNVQFITFMQHAFTKEKEHDYIFFESMVFTNNLMTSLMYGLITMLAMCKLVSLI